MLLLLFTISSDFFNRHGGVDPGSFICVANQLDCVLQTASSSDTGTGDEHAQRVIQVYDALCKQIRVLELPLIVNLLQGISPVFRGAEVVFNYQTQTLSINESPASKVLQ